MMTSVFCPSVGKGPGPGIAFNDINLYNLVQKKFAIVGTKPIKLLWIHGYAVAP